jgi:ribosomal protein L37AE/L43A
MKFSYVSEIDTVLGEDAPELIKGASDMPMNRVQLQPGLPMRVFLSRYGTDEQCEAALLMARWPEGFICPGCGGRHASEFRRDGRQYWQCSHCRRQTSLLSGTIFAASKLPLSVWFLAMQLLTQAKNNVSALELRRQLGVCYRTAWLIKRKLTEVMCQRESNRVLEGRVEMDDAYLGGQRTGGKVGRGSENKVSLVAAVQTTADGKPVAMCLHMQPFTKAAMADFARRHLSAKSCVVSDGLKCFEAVRSVGIEHERTVTGGGVHSVKLPQFKAINTVLGNLKTAISGTYHAFDFAKYGHRYLAQVQYLFNRRFDLSVILVRLLRAAALTPRQTERKLRLAEVHR